ncbi:sugar transporter erd6-like 5, partial [Quercus suber]
MPTLKATSSLFLSKAKIGSKKECEVAVQQLRGQNTDISQEVAETRSTRKPFNGFLKLVGLGLVVLQQFGEVNGITFYASAIFISTNSIDGIGVILIDKSGQQPLLLVSAVGTCLGCLLMGLSFFLQVYIGSFSLGMGGIPWVIMSEGSTGSLVTLVNWLDSWIISYASNFLMEWSLASSAKPVLSLHRVVILAKLVFETKGQPLEEIQASLNPFSTKRCISYPRTM